MSQNDSIRSLEEPRLHTTEDNDQRLTIESVKYAQREITAITSDPESVYFNLKAETFNLIYRAADWARRTPVWSDFALFVIQNFNNKGIIKAVHTATRKMMIKKPEYKRYATENPFNDWRDSVIRWWNDFVDKGYSTKMPQLYLFGPSNVGKTTFIFDLLS